MGRRVIGLRFKQGQLRFFGSTRGSDGRIPADENARSAQNTTCTHERKMEDLLLAVQSPTISQWFIALGAVVAIAAYVICWRPFAMEPDRRWMKQALGLDCVAPSA